MITLHNLEWSNFGPYAENNSLKLDQYPICQLNGANGAGKTTIATIIEELLTNKNTRGFKKSELLRRNSEGKALQASITFSKASNIYKLETRRTASKATVRLFENDVDVSSHRVADTYKKLEEIFGMPTALLAKLLYQSSKQSLEFLTTTDAKRKQFLVQFLNIEEYSEKHDRAKAYVKELEAAISSENQKILLAQNTIDALKDATKVTPLKEELYDLDALEKELDELRDALAEIQTATNNANLLRKAEQELEELEKETLAEVPEDPGTFDEDEPTSTVGAELSKVRHELKLLKLDKAKQESNLVTVEQAITKLENSRGKTVDSPQCAICGKELASALDAQQNFEDKREELEQERSSLVTMISELSTTIKDLETTISSLEKEEEEYEQKRREFKQRRESHRRLQQIYREIISSNGSLVKRINSAKAKVDGLRESSRSFRTYGHESDADIRRRISEIKEAISEESAIRQHNATARELNERAKENRRTVETKSRLIEEANQQLKVLTKSLGIGKTLVEATKGVITYKIENSAFVLEKLANTHLQKFSSGKFLLRMRVAGDKLPVTILNEGEEVGIHTLSTGEHSWVNVSVLLAIRKFLTNIAGTQINFLMLDELSGVLDESSKEKLIEILLEEQELNTFMVSHDYSHPLVHNYSVQKDERDISKIS